jgi:hypothetical protein
MRVLVDARAGVRAWRSRPLEVHERAVHGARAEARCVLRVGGEDEGEGGGGGGGGGGGAGAGGCGGHRLLRQKHEQGLLAAQGDGLVDGEEGHDGLLPGRAPGAASREAARETRSVAAGCASERAVSRAQSRPTSPWRRRREAIAGRRARMRGGC